MGVSFWENVGLALIVSILVTSKLMAQSVGNIEGRVLDLRTQLAVEAVDVMLADSSVATASGKTGRFILTGLRAGNYVLRFSAAGYESQEITNVEIRVGETTRVDVFMQPEIFPVENIVVLGISRRSKRILATPATVNRISARKIQIAGDTGQIHSALSTETGVDITQNGLNDFNLNTRGFNTTLNRRVLVLQDNRETAMALLSAQEWNTLSIPLKDFSEIEFVRGPASTLYGANAFSGVLNIKTPDPASVQGTKVFFSTGELGNIRGDVMHAGSGERWGHKFNFGGFRSGTWSRSRNISQDRLDREEYSGLTPEQLPLVDDDLTSVYASARLDYNFDNNSVLTVESGVTQTEDQVYVSNIGRIQVDALLRPWSRLSFSSDRFFFQADYNVRKTLNGHQRVLNTGAVLIENSSDFNFQFQHNLMSNNRNWRLIWGASHKFQNVNTDHTFITGTFHENSSGLFGQFDLKVSNKLKAVAATRIDRSTLHAIQLSPNVTLVFAPAQAHSIRATVGRAFQTPDYGELFLKTLAGPPTDLAQLEQDLEIEIARVENLPAGSVDLPLNFGFTPFLALGNERLDVERIHSYELGYQGQVLHDFQVSANVYFNRLNDFISDLLPGINPAFAPYRLPDGIPERRRQIAESFLRDTINAGLTTLADGSEAFVISHANVDKINEWGIELGTEFSLSRRIKVSGNYSFFDYEVKDQTFDGRLLSNTPSDKFNISVHYETVRGLNFGLSLRHVGAVEWASGVFAGHVPAYTLLNFAGGFKFDRKTRLGVVIINALDNNHYELFGGSLNGRRAVISIGMEF